MLNYNSFVVLGNVQIIRIPALENINEEVYDNLSPKKREGGGEQNTNPPDNYRKF